MSHLVLEELFLKNQYHALENGSMQDWNLHIPYGPTPDEAIPDDFQASLSSTWL